MSTDDGKALVQDIAAKIRMLQEQREELATALRKLVTLNDCDLSSTTYTEWKADWAGAIKEARAVIARIPS